MNPFNDLKRASMKHKNNKPYYYVLNYLRQIIPPIPMKEEPEAFLKRKSEADREQIQHRIDYYNKLAENISLPDNAIKLSDLKVEKHFKTYIFDTLEYTRRFPRQLKILPLFGDITTVPDYPSITKSRPIATDNANSVILKLDKVRHFTLINDSNRFVDKKNMLVGRSKARQQHRIAFLNMYFNHPMCNVGQVNHDQNLHFMAPRLTIEEHLKYKFILCLEGNDVASNLKWVMSSNSIAVMPKPKYETWFMEGTLIPNYHYILIKDDYSDLEERLNYYIEHTDEALQIIENAHRYVAPFRDKEQEDKISLLVLKKYFERTNQL